jgi:hypothetical protein
MNTHRNAHVLPASVSQAKTATMPVVGSNEHHGARRDVFMPAASWPLSRKRSQDVAHTTEQRHEQQVPLSIQAYLKYA